MHQAHNPHSTLNCLANCPDGVMVVDADQTIIVWNEGAHSILGHEAGDVLGRLCYDVFRGVDGAGDPVCMSSCDDICQAASDGTVPNRDLQLRTRNGRRIWINVSHLTLGGSLAHVFRDVTDGKDLENLWNGAQALLEGE